MVSVKPLVKSELTEEGVNFQQSSENKCIE